MPKVSIVLCSYNGEQYLSEQIESILDQSYKDFELIICDDQSSDNSFNIINDFAKKDARIKAHSNSNNLGYVKNFEKGISLAKGDYIALSDQDDVWALDKIEKLLEHKGLKRVLKFLEILNHLAKTDDYILLNADGFAFETEAQDSAKIGTIFKYVRENFEHHIPLDEIADKVSMTVPAFCRYFKKFNRC